MRQSEFQRAFSRQEAPLAVGSVRGVRSWVTNPEHRISVRQLSITTTRAVWVPNFSLPPGAEESAPPKEPTGILTGLAGYDWTPGENVAECRRGDLSLVEYMPRLHAESVDPACTCGFYAYWTITPEAVSGTIVGVIEGYGKTVIGSRGFRCEKAKILAVAPILNKLGDVDDEHVAALAAVRRRYPEVAVFDSAKLMLEEFPPTDAPELPPEEKPEWRWYDNLAFGTQPITAPSLHVQQFRNAMLGISISADEAKTLIERINSAFKSDPDGGDDSEQAKRQRALDASKARHTGPKRNPFRRRGRTA